MSENNNATPPRDHDWGERTKQSVRHNTAPGYWKPDAYEIRQYYGIPEFDPNAFDHSHPENPENVRMVYPDLVCHEAKARALDSNRGTDCLIKGDRDAGKTTFAHSLAVRLMEDYHGIEVGDHPESDRSAAEIEDHNDHIVVWRGSSERSGWLRFKKWTTLYLPAHGDVEARWMNESDQPTESIDDLEAIVRDVVYYEDVYDLLDKLGEGKTGTFNVVYPDPSFTGCERVMRETDRVAGTPRYRSESETGQDEEPTSVYHWWFAFLVARTEYGPMEWMALIFDEANDLLPSDASNDDDDHAKKIELLRSIWASSRKRLLSMFWFVHHEEAIHPKIRREVKWRIDMPDDEPNPRMKRKSSIPVGLGKVPMIADITSKFNKGRALCYTASAFTLFSWTDIPGFPEEDDRWLNVGVEAVESGKTGSAEDGQPLEFDENVFSEWENQTSHRLYVNDPGEGYLSVGKAEIVQDLSSPIEGLTFVDEFRDQDDHREVLMQRTDSPAAEKLVVARIPVENLDDNPGSSTPEVGV